MWRQGPGRIPSATSLPVPPTPLTPRSLPLRDQVQLAQRVAVARAVGVPWKEISAAEEMAERTLRHLLQRWRAEPVQTWDESLARATIARVKPR